MKCVICKHGETKEGTTTVTFDRDGMTLVVKDVPAQICTNCGEDYMDEHVSHEILAIAERNRKERGAGRCPKVEFPALQCPVN
jgi:YgiT-type zinc finger domain-containing protein